MPSRLKKAIDAVKDQTSISIAKVSSNNSSNLDVAVLKATTHDDWPVDEKHILQVLHLVSSNKSQAATCARAIGKRIGRTRSWVVALKSLMLVLRIFQDGDPYFPREVLHCMKRGAKILNLASFRDDSNSSPWDYTAFVRTVALYLDERLECFLTGKLQRRYTNGVKEIGPRYQWAKIEPVRDVKPAMLLDKISYWQCLLERAIATRPTGPAKTHSLIQTSLYAIVQESFELYKDISDGLTLILDSFFHLQFQNCMHAFEACVKATKQFKELSDFYSLCKSIGIGRSSEYPSVQTISEELIEALNEFLKDQSSFPSNSKPSSPFSLPQGNVMSRSERREQSPDVSNTVSSGEMGSRCTSLSELINATETETGACHDISIDLEAYSPAQHDDSFRVSETGSTRSLPVSNSMVDLMSLWDWNEQQEQENQQQQQKQQQQEFEQNEFFDSSSSQNWELVLAETIMSSSASPPSEEKRSNKADISTNSWQAAEESPSTSADNSSNTWQMVLFPQQPCTEQPLPNLAMPTNNHYNPFLQNTIELPHVPSLQHVSPLPTFQALPSFSSMQNPIQPLFTAHGNRENDPFANSCSNSLSSEPMCSSDSIDQQNLLLEQQLWLQNQNKIISKHLT